MGRQHQKPPSKEQEGTTKELPTGTPKPNGTSTLHNTTPTKDQRRKGKKQLLAGIPIHIYGAQKPYHTNQPNNKEITIKNLLKRMQTTIWGVNPTRK